MTTGSSDKEASPIERKRGSVPHNHPGHAMGGQMTKVQPKTGTQKSRNRQQETESSHPNKQAMLPCPGSAPQPVFTPGTVHYGGGQVPKVKETAAPGRKI